MTTVLQEKIMASGMRTLDARLRAHFLGCRVRTMIDPFTRQQKTTIEWRAGHSEAEMQLFILAYTLGNSDASFAIVPEAGLELTGRELARKEDMKRPPAKKTDPNARRRLDELFEGGE